LPICPADPFHLERTLKPKHVQGIYAAILTPRSLHGDVDVPAFTAIIRFLVEKGVQRFAVNGATGEFCLTTPTQLELLLTAVKATCKDAEVLCGVGAAGAAQTRELVEIAQNAGVHGLLLPMPYFFPYDQQDLVAFCEEIARNVTVPVLLYNLPQFTTGLDAQTVCDLCQSVPNIIGIKDSSGSLDVLRALRNRVPNACRIIGNDQALAPALQEGLCDGVVSGVACVVPELIQALYNQPTGGPGFVQLSCQLDELIEQLNAFPTPWGLKWVAEERGLPSANFTLPVSRQRRADAAVLKQWCRTWLTTL